MASALLSRSVPNCNEMQKAPRTKVSSSLADEVLGYLVKRGTATGGNPADTVEGIVAWWLPIQRIQYAITEVQAALRDLVDRGFVIERKAPDGLLHYRMNPEKMKEIRHRLQAKTRGSAGSARPRLGPRKHN